MLPEGLQFSTCLKNGVGAYSAHIDKRVSIIFWQYFLSQRFLKILKDKIMDDKLILKLLFCRQSPACGTGAFGATAGARAGILSFWVPARPGWVIVIEKADTHFTNEKEKQYVVQNACAGHIDTGAVFQRLRAVTG
jgi:hypothetical protein